MLLELSFIFFFSLASLFFMREVAKTLNLVDTPSQRKQHTGAIPLVGGISICITLAHFIYTNPDIIEHSSTFLISIVILTFVGALDDKFDINFSIRLVIQATLSICVMISTGIELNTLGNILGLGEIKLGPFGYIITVIAVIGVVNAFNMVDGIDGLLGGLSIVTFTSLAILLFISGQYDLAYFCIVIVTSIVPYILLNLGLLKRRRKVFMGDAGSMLIGFTVIWLLLLSSQNGVSPPLRPVTALWLVALPLMDMSSVIIRRILKGSSPFKPDREHLHHIFQELGFSSNKTLFIICFISMLFAVFGIYGELMNVSESLMLYSFLICFILYTFTISNAFRISKALKILK